MVLIKSIDEEISWKLHDGDNFNIFAVKNTRKLIVKEMLPEAMHMNNWLWQVLPGNNAKFVVMPKSEDRSKLSLGFKCAIAVDTGQKY